MSSFQQPEPIIVLYHITEVVKLYLCLLVLACCRQYDKLLRVYASKPFFRAFSDNPAFSICEAFFGL